MVLKKILLLFSFNDPVIYNEWIKEKKKKVEGKGWFVESIRYQLKVTRYQVKSE